jgi:hypothetical protein
MTKAANAILAPTEPCTLATGYNHKLLQRFQHCSAISPSESVEKVRRELSASAKFSMCVFRYVTAKMLVLKVIVCSG